MPPAAVSGAGAANATSRANSTDATTPAETDADAAGKSPTQAEPPAASAGGSAPDTSPDAAETDAGGVPLDRSQPNAEGKYIVCQSSDTQRWGDDLPDRVLKRSGQPCQLNTRLDGTVALDEYFGGFDGFFSADPADGHEDCFNGAVAEMLGRELCEVEVVDIGKGENSERLRCLEGDGGTAGCVCLGMALQAVLPWAGNEVVEAFLLAARTEADPTDFEYPEDEALADDGGRASNVEKVQAVLESMIDVQRC